MDIGEIVSLAQRDAATALTAAAANEAVSSEDDVDVGALVRRLLAPPRFAAGALAESAPLAALLANFARHCFCISLHRAQLEALCGLLADVVAEDVRVWQRSARASFAHFQRELLAISVDRPPRSVALLSPAEAAMACDYVLKAYFANFKLFKSCLAVVPEPLLAQRAVAAVEEPAAPPPLVHAVMLAERAAVPATSAAAPEGT